MLTELAAAKTRKGKKSSKEEEKSKESEDDDGSDFEEAGARKRLNFRSKLLDAKLSDSNSDSEIEIKRRKKG